MPPYSLPVNPGELSLKAPPTPEQLHDLRRGEYHNISIFYGDYRNLHFLAEGAGHIRKLTIHADMGHNLQVLRDLPRLQILNMRGLVYAPGFDPSYLPALRRLNITWHPDYPPLHAPLLDTLFFHGLPAPDLRSIYAPVLHRLSVNGSQLQSTRGVENFSQLEQLWLMQQHRLEDLSGVEQLHSLQKFTYHSFDESHWQPPYPLQRLKQLRRIDIQSRQRGVLFPELHWLEDFMDLEYFTADTRSTHLNWHRLFSLPRLNFIALSVNAEGQTWWESELRSIARACGREVENLSSREGQGILHCSVLFK